LVVRVELANHRLVKLPKAGKIEEKCGLLIEVKGNSPPANAVTNCDRTEQKRNKSVLPSIGFSAIGENSYNFGI